MGNDFGGEGRGGGTQGLVIVGDASNGGGSGTTADVVHDSVGGGKDE